MELTASAHRCGLRFPIPLMAVQVSSHESSAESYAYDYLIPTKNDRTAVLAPILRPYLLPGDHALDLLCGFSPVSSLLLDLGCTVEGFDLSEEAIQYCRDSYPSGLYERAGFAEFDPPEKIDILVHIGIYPELKKDRGVIRTELSTSLGTVLCTLPRIVIVEGAAHVPWRSGYTVFKERLEFLRLYEFVKTTRYEFHPDADCRSPYSLRASRRLITVFRRRENVKKPRELATAYLAKLQSLEPRLETSYLLGENVGFGREFGAECLHWGLYCALRPKKTIVCGSNLIEFAISFAFACRENEHAGEVLFVMAEEDDRVSVLIEQLGLAHLLDVLVSDFTLVGMESSSVDLFIEDIASSGGKSGGNLEDRLSAMAPGGLFLQVDSRKLGNRISDEEMNGSTLWEVVERDSRFSPLRLPIRLGVGLLRKFDGDEFTGRVAAPWLREFIHGLAVHAPIPAAPRRFVRRKMLRLLSRLFPDSY